MTTQLKPGSPPTRTATAPPVWAVLASGAAAPLLAWSLLTGPLGADLAVHSGTGTRSVGAPSVLVAAVAASLGTLALGRLAARARWGRRHFVLLSLGLLVVSLIGPLGSGTTPAARWCLTTLHVVVAATVLPLVARRLVRR